MDLDIGGEKSRFWNDLKKKIADPQNQKYITDRKKYKKNVRKWKWKQI